jgi:putative endonuclease
MYYTYVLQGDVDYQFYVGYSKNLKLRFERHNNGYIHSTKERRRLKLIYYEACLTQQDALQREKYLKTWHGKQFLHKRLKSYLTG